jgi:hypothetical protein
MGSSSGGILGLLSHDLRQKSKELTCIRSQEALDSVLIRVGGVPLRGLHCLAWNSVFPSYVQQLLWPISSAIVIAAGIPALLSYFSLEVVESCYWVAELSPSDRSLQRRSQFSRRWRKYISWLQKLSSRMGWYGSGTPQLTTF